MNPTILFVDAASAERESWKAFLENQKYSVFTAENSEAARRLCLERQPDLVLLHDHPPHSPNPGGFALRGTDSERTGART